MTYPQHVPNGTPKKSKTKVVLLSALGVIAVLILVGTCSTVVSGTDKQPSNTPAIQEANAPATGWEGNTPAPKSAVNPLVTDGTYLVGTEIQPGTYKVEPAEGSFGGYWERCADLKCEIDMDGSDATGLIENESVTAPGYLVIEPTDVAVKLTNVVLTPQENP